MKLFRRRAAVLAVAANRANSDRKSDVGIAVCYIVDVFLLMMLLIWVGLSCQSLATLRYYELCSSMSTATKAVLLSYSEAASTEIASFSNITFAHLQTFFSTGIIGEGYLEQKCFHLQPASDFTIPAQCFLPIHYAESGVTLSSYFLSYDFQGCVGNYMDLMPAHQVHIIAQASF